MCNVRFAFTSEQYFAICQRRGKLMESSSSRFDYPKLFHVLIFCHRKGSRIFLIRYYASKVMDAIVCLVVSFHVKTVRYGTCKIWNVNPRDAFRVIAHLGAKSRFFFHVFLVPEITRELLCRRRCFAVLHSILLFNFHSLFIISFYPHFHKWTTFPSKLKIVCKVRSLVDVISIHRFDETTRVFPSSQTMTKGEVRLCTERGHYADSVYWSQ